jgi:hypothetical protein
MKYFILIILLASCNFEPVVGIWNLPNSSYIYSNNGVLFYNDSNFTFELKPVGDSVYFYKPFVINENPVKLEITKQNIDLVVRQVSDNKYININRDGTYISILYPFKEFSWDSITYEVNPKVLKSISKVNIPKEMQLRFSNELFILTHRNYSVNEIGVDNALPITIYNDNISTNHIAKVTHFYNSILSLTK